MDDKYKRINVLIRKDQYENVHLRKLSLSGLIRDLIDDRFSDTRITLSVSPGTTKLYNHVISNFGAADAELEQYIVKALDSFLVQKSRDIDKLRKKIEQHEQIPRKSPKPS